MEESLLNFHQQFSTELEIGNGEEWQQYARFLVAGMGGSALPSQILSLFRPELDLVIHRDYGLPVLAQDRWQERLVIASSYSGNTQETLNALDEARRRHVPVAVISTGGKLLEIAQREDIPFVKIPDSGLLPRVAVGVSFLGLCKLTGQEELYEKTRQLAFQLKPKDLKSQGERLSKELLGKIPVIYGSGYSFPIAKQWKIAFNETTRIPAFANAFPELNHNEMAGFDVMDSTRELASRFHIVLLRNEEDSSQIKKRMGAAQDLWRARGVQVTQVELQGSSEALRVFSSILVGHFAALALAKHYGTASEKDAMIEEFKKRVS